MKSLGEASASHPEAGRTALHSLQAHGKILWILCPAGGDINHFASIDILIESTVIGGVAGYDHQIVALRLADGRHLHIGKGAQSSQGWAVLSHIQNPLFAQSRDINIG